MINAAANWISKRFSKNVYELHDDGDDDDGGGGDGGGADDGFPRPSLASLLA